MRDNDNFEPPATPPGACSGLDAGWQPIGSLQTLYLRAGKEPAPRPVTSAQAIAGLGLAGDRHASACSPRQLLLAGDCAYQRWNLPPASLRENLRVDFSTAQLVSGDLLRVGPEAVLWMTFLCEPCGLLERRCPGTLKTIGAQRGMLARVLRAGPVRAGDEIAVRRASAPVFSDDWAERVLQVARAVPEGHSISYRQLAEMAGVATAYCRAFPRVLARVPPAVALRVASEARIKGAIWSGAGFFDSDGR